VDTTRRRVLEVQNHPVEVRIFEDGALIASDPALTLRIRLAVATSVAKTVAILLSRSSENAKNPLK